MKRRSRVVLHRVRRFLHLVLMAARRKRCPLIDRRGFPVLAHPESLDCELPGRDEEWLGALEAELWPDDEYAEIVRRDPPEGTAR